ncbi:Mitochondrial intermediate peptidase [Varicellaria rhodocarpa]|nr:Mitochondrial intermediate peptidase [Varicellaria rhodocarpa]
MQKTLHRQPWTCTRCLLPQQTNYRPLATAKAASHAEPLKNCNVDNFYQASLAAPSTSHDDKALRQIFDSQSFWRDFSRPKYQSLKTSNVGLFQNKYLTGPHGFMEFAQESIKRCQVIVDRVLNISTVEGYKSIVKDLDRLSDLLCRVIDLSDFVRATHPDASFQNAAAEAHGGMFDYMNTLNTTTGLCEQLQKALANSEVVGSWSEEEKTMARILMKDFSQSAIDLPENKRQRFVELSGIISQLGFKIVDELEPAQSRLTLDSNRLKGMDPMVLRQATNGRGRVYLPTTGPMPATAMRQVEDEEIRRQIYMANRTASKKQISNVEHFLKLRAELADLSGFSSFADMTLADKMAKSPEAVDKFLKALSTKNAPKMQQELSELQSLKNSLAKNVTSSQVNAWDKDYLGAKLRLYRRPISRKPDFLSAYFPLGSVIQGLSRLFTRLYGVRLVPRELTPGETWDPDVRRLDVIDDSEGHIAVLYCDLFARVGKNPNPAHFTIRCSRHITRSEVEEATSSSTSDSPSSSTLSQLTNDGMATSLTPDKKLYQLPTIALICDFPPPSSSSYSTSATPTPTLLCFEELTTLFHEMGHAIHSILGRTDLQGVSGTRCATDFAELPSVLMEHFAGDEAVLRLFAHHWNSNAPLPYEMVREKVDSHHRSQAADIEHSIVLSALDQAYHSSIPLQSPDFDSTEVFHDTLAKWSHLPEPPGTSWQGFFGHLVGYGGSYYSYLFDRAIAGRVWEGVFSSGRDGGSISRENGERYKKEVLRWGGSRNGWECVAGVLGGKEGEVLKNGGEAAMETVGKWGVGD